MIFHLKNSLFFLFLFISGSSVGMPTEDEARGITQPVIIGDTEKQREDDLNIIKKANVQAGLLEQIITKDHGLPDFVRFLGELGASLRDLSWNMKDEKNIRNVHGYRNRHEKRGNTRNLTGARIDFEELQHLSLAATTPWAEYLYKDKDRTLNSLGVLRSRLSFITLSEAQKEGRPAVEPSGSLGILLKVSSFVHDVACLQSMRGFLETLCCVNMRELDYGLIINRFALAYKFVQFGETAKQLSDFVKADVYKDGKQNVLRYFFGRLANYRQLVKNYPHSVIAGTPSLIRHYNRLLLYSHDIVSVLNALQSSLQHVLEAEGREEALFALESLYINSNTPMLSFKIDKSINVTGISAGLALPERSTETKMCEEIDAENRALRELEAEAASFEASPSAPPHLEQQAPSSNQELLWEFRQRVLSTKIVKQFIRLFSMLRPLCLGDAPDPLADPTGFKKHLESTPQESEETRRKVGGLLGLLSKFKLEKLREEAVKLQEATKFPVPLDDLLELCSFVNQRSVVDPNSSGANAEGTTGVGQNTRKAREQRLQEIRKKMKVLRGRIQRLNADLDTLRDVQTRYRSPHFPLVPVNPIVIQPSPRQSSPALDAVQQVLRVYTVLAGLDECGVPDFVREGASTMAIGFLGEYYKLIFEQERWIANIFMDRSPMLSSMISAKDLRNRRVMHNSKSYETRGSLATIRDHVSPWEIDMFYLREFCGALDLDMNTYLSLQLPWVKQKIAKHQYTEEEEKVFLMNIVMRALLRFVRHNQAVAFSQANKGLVEKEGIGAKLVCSHFIWVARALRELGHTDSLRQAHATLNELDDKIADFPEGKVKKKYQARSQLERAHVCLLQYNCGRAEEIAIPLAENGDSGLQQEAQRILATSKIQGDHEEGIRAYASLSRKQLEGATYSDLVYRAILLTATYTMNGNYQRAKVFAQYIERIFEAQRALFRRNTGHMYDYVRGSLCYVRGILWFNQGVVTRDSDLLRRCLAEHQEQIGFLERAQPGSDLTKRMYYRMGRVLLFLEDEAQEAEEYFSKWGSTELELDGEDETDIKRLVDDLIWAVFLRYANGYVRHEDIAAVDKKLASSVQESDMAQILREITGHISRIHNYYLSLARDSVRRKNWVEAKQAFEYSCYASHLARFVDRMFLDIAQELRPYSEAEFPLILKATLRLLKMDIADLFEGVETYLHTVKFSGYRVNHLTKQYFPERIMSSFGDVVSLYFESLADEGGTSEIQIATGTLLALYERVLPSKGLLAKLGYKKTYAVLKRVTSGPEHAATDAKSFCLRMFDVIELRQASFWYAFWYLTQPEIEISPRLQDPFRKAGLICGAKLLAGLDAGAVTEESSAKEIQEFLFDDSPERSVLSMENPSYGREEHRDASTFIDHFKHLEGDSMFDPRMMFYQNQWAGQDLENENPAIIATCSKYIDEQRYNKAIKTLKRYVSRYPKSGIGHYHLGVANYFVSDLRRAKTSFLRAAALGHQEAQATLDAYF